jgi:hypothetical protein
MSKTRLLEADLPKAKNINEYGHARPVPAVGRPPGSHLARLAGVRPLSDPRPPARELNVMDYHVLIERVRCEFLEMPGLRLTPAQAARLWNVDSATCQHVITALVRSAFLRWTPRGTVMRAEG